MEVRAFDLFSGCGGSSIGARLAGAEVVGSVDQWDFAARSYAANFPHAKVYDTPLEGLSPRRIAAAVGKVDLLLASPECTNHTCARGARPDNEASRNTAMQVVRFAEAWLPRWIIVE